ncbi:MAG: MBOAT family protein [Oscillospiraceae bacterium]|nr:MBOAT family protein [Oscillospiraceae bacterium]
MVFSSLTFLFFFLPITLAVNLILPKKVRNYWLLAASLVFYAWGAGKFVLVMIASILVNYVFARLIDSSSNERFRRVCLVLAVIANLGVLFYNKYMNFFTENLQKIFGDSIVVTNIILPIGISFFTFQALSYVVDVYRKDTPVQKNPYYLGLYIAFFPQLIAGPIVRYRTIADQIEERTITAEKFASGVSRFCGGFAMKVLLANNLSVVADAAFDLSATPGNLSVCFAWLGAIAYTLQILFDFSGYSSMAIGLGRMFGFEFMENFNYPYISKNVTEFWRRWHISLSQWFRDYVYFPLGGSRVDKKYKLVRNLFAVWILTGIWHGANWTFICWGLGYFILLTFEKLTNLPKRELPRGGVTLYRIFTLLCVMIGWVVFRADNLRYAKRYLFAMFGLAGNAFVDSNAIRYANDYKILLVIALICCTPALKKLKEWLCRKCRAETAVTAVFDLCAVGLVIVSVSYLVMGGNNPFIYFNF